MISILDNTFTVYCFVGEDIESTPDLQSGSQDNGSDFLNSADNSSGNASATSLKFLNLQRKSYLSLHKTPHNVCLRAR